MAASPSPSASAAAVTPTLPAGWTSLGCYTDDNGKRALSQFYNEPSGGMTVEYCISKCAANGYNLGGLEYGGECYCDSVIQNNHGLAPDGNAQCNMACHGNAGEICGGPARLNMYAAGPGWTKYGCFTDQPYKRTLAVAPSYTGDLTVEKCLDICHAQNFAYGAPEYGNECHCGNSFDNGGSVAPDGNAGCSFACAGNSSEICGGSQRLSMYVYVNADGTISSAAPSSTPSATAGTGTGNSPSTPTPETSNIPSGWSYQGCYTDQTNARSLSNQQPDSSSLTAASCISACSSAQYSVAGLEYGSQCFCGNALNGASAAAAGTCNMQCSGDSSKSCGAGGAVDVYSFGTLQNNPKPVPQTSGLPDGWSYTDCFADSIDSRLFPVEIDQASATASSCIAYCSGQSYSAAGIEYSNQCFCGSTQDLTKSTASRSTQCSMTCAGNSSSICGGPGAITVYQLSTQ